MRFGNVLGSRGCVLTAFHAQIEAGGPLTVTHPEVTRYFMTVEEAVQLVIQAGAVGQAGEALVLDMGEPVRIDDVARRLATQAKRPVEVQYVGLRHGEKLHEVLLGAGELDRRPNHPQISQVPVPPLAYPAGRGAVPPGSGRHRPGGRAGRPGRHRHRPPGPTRPARSTPQPSTTPRPEPGGGSTPTGPVAVQGPGTGRG